MFNCRLGNSAPIIGLVCAGTLSAGAATPKEPFQNLSITQALTRATEQQKVVFIDFYTTWCGPCKRLDSTTWKDEKVIAVLKENAVSLKIDAEKDSALSKKYAVNAYPTLLLLKPDGTVLDRMVGYQKPDAFIASFQSALKGITSLDRARNEVSEASKGSLEDQVEAREKLAQVLMERGQHEEALREYLWLYDDGMKRVKAYAGVRNTILLSGLQRLSEDYPPALEALRQHRDKARALFLASPGDPSAARDLTSLNQALKEDLSSLEVFDQLPAGSPGRKVLGSQLWKELIEQKRYSDALCAKSPEDLLNQISKHENFVPPDPDLQKAVKASWLELIASGIEALAGTSRLDEAKPLIKKALAIDPSPEAHKLIEKHIQRSGKPVSLDSLL